MVTFANLGSVRLPSFSEDTAHLVCQLSIYNSFPPQLEKNRRFYVPRPSFFVCPGNAPVAITQNIAWMKRQFSACQTPCSMYPSIFNSFPVIRTASAKNRPFHILQPTHLFPLETPLWLSRSKLHGWKDNSMLAKPLAACTCLCSTVSELYDAEVNAYVQKSLFLPHFCFPWGRPWGNHASLSVVWMEIEFDAYKLSRCMCPSNYKRFWDRARYWWKIIFSYPPCIRRPR